MPRYKSPGYTPVKNHFRSYIFAEVEQLFCYNLYCVYNPNPNPVWLGGRVVKTRDLRSIGREFESRPLCYRVQPWTS